MRENNEKMLEVRYYSDLRLSETKEIIVGAGLVPARVVNNASGQGQAQLSRRSRIHLQIAITFNASPKLEAPSTL
jgi:hypothetical protein